MLLLFRLNKNRAYTISQLMVSYILIMVFNSIILNKAHQQLIRFENKKAAFYTIALDSW